MSAQDDEQIKKRLKELLERSRQRGIFFYTDFHSMYTAAMAYELADAREVQTWGGYEDSERVMIRFGDPAEIGYDEPFPIQIVRVSPKRQKYADKLTHRDFLGALMSLGMERDVLGDILIHENEAFVFVTEKMADFIMESLTSVKHTAVNTAFVDELPPEARPQIKREEINIASLRLDGIVSKVFHLSRQEAKSLFSSEKIYINGRPEPGAGREPKENDVISVQGHGKFIYYGFLHETKKGRLVAEIGKYI